MKKLLLLLMMVLCCFNVQALELKETLHTDTLHVTVIGSEVRSIEYRFSYRPKTNNLSIQAFRNGKEFVEYPADCEVLVKEEYEYLCGLFENSEEGDYFWWDIFFVEDNEKYLKDYIDYINKNYFNKK